MELALLELLKAADNAKTPEEATTYLALITEQYQFCEQWDKLLKDDKHKFVAALLSFRSNNNDRCELFLSPMNLEAFVNRENQDILSHEALLMFRALRPSIYHKLLPTTRENTILSDATLQQHVAYLLAKKHYALVLQLASTINDYPGKFTAMANATYWSSEGKNTIDSLQWLMRESEKDINYWMVFYNLLANCHHLLAEILNASRDSYLRLTLFLKISAQHCLLKMCDGVGKN